jgi:hypothetical protein
MKYKKILATVGSLVMLGATMAGAFAASVPTGFNADNTVIVMGSGTGVDDDLAKSVILSPLAATAQGTSGSVSVSGGTMVPIETRTNKLNVGEQLDGVKVKLTSTDLPELLATGRIRSGSQNVDTTQELFLGNAKVVFDALGDEDDYVINTAAAEDKLPVLYLGNATSTAWRLKVTFSESINASALRSTEKLTIAGREFTFDPTMDLGEVIMYASATTAVIGDGASEDVSIGGDDFTIAVTGANTVSGNARITIDGEAFSVDEGDTIYVRGQRFYVNDIFVSDVGTVSTAQVEIFVGADKIEISNTGAIELNDETLEGVTATENLDSTALTSIEFTFKPGNLDADTEEASYLEMGEAIVDPLFGTIITKFDGVSPALKSSDRGMIEVSKSSDDLRVVLKNRDGNTIDIKPYSVSSTELDDHEYFLGGGALINLSNREWFILQDGSEAENYVTKVIEVSGNPKADEITLKELTTGSSSTFTNTTIGELFGTGYYVCNEANGATGWWIDTAADCDEVTTGILGNLTVYSEDNVKTVMALDDDGNVTITLTEDNGDANGTIMFVIGAKYNADDDIHVTVDASAYGESADDDTGYYLSAWGTYVEAEEDDNTNVKIWTTAEEAEYQVLVGSGSISTTPGEEGNLVVTDTEAASITNKNMIVVGGSAINSMAATLLGVPYPTAGAAFTAATDIGAGEALIESFERGSNVAVLVAGYEQTQTHNAASYLVNQNPDVSAGKSYKVSSATAATAITA